jgi:hypothetical protein
MKEQNIRQCEYEKADQQRKYHKESSLKALPESESIKEEDPKN